MFEHVLHDSNYPATSLVPATSSSPSLVAPKLSQVPVDALDDGGDDVAVRDRVGELPHQATPHLCEKTVTSQNRPAQLSGQT
eukprot:765677-Hanusia_phi.AAC.6